jgi:hypothetical protein
MKWPYNKPEEITLKQFQLLSLEKKEDYILQIISIKKEERSVAQQYILDYCSNYIEPKENKNFFSLK